MPAQRHGAYLTTSEKGCEGSGGLFKVNLKSLFSLTKGEGVEWLRIHRVQFDTSLQLMSRSAADAEKSSFALPSPAHSPQPPLQVHCWCCWPCSSHEYGCPQRRGGGTTGLGTLGRGCSSLSKTLWTYITLSSLWNLTADPQLSKLLKYRPNLRHTVYL